MRPIIPEKLQKRKLILIPSLNLSLFDLLVFTICLAPGLIVAILYVKQNLLAIIPCLFGFFIGFLLNRTSSKHKIKNYVFLVNWFFNLFVHKKYKFGDKNYSTLNLIPYERVVGDFIKIKPYKLKKNGNEETFYLSMIRVEGTNFEHLEAEKKADTLMGIWNAIRKLKYGGSFIAINEFKNSKETIFLLEDQIQKLEKNKKNNKINDLEYYSRKFVDMKDIEELISLYDPQKTQELNIVKNIYIAFYAKDIEDLAKVEAILVNDLNYSYLNPHKLSIYEKINVINKLLDTDIEDDSDSNIEEFMDRLDEYFAYDELQNNPDYLLIDDNWRFKIQGVTNWQYEQNLNWIGALFSLNQNAVLNFKRASESIYESILNKAQRNADLSFQTTKKKEVFARRKRQKEVEKLEEFADIIGYGHDELYEMNFYIIHKEIDKKEYFKSIKEVNEILNSKDLKLRTDYNIFQQLEGLSAILPKPIDPLMENHGVALPLYTIAYGNPFIKNGLNDPRGLYIGKDQNQDPILLDTHVRDANRKNSNMFFVAKSGAGKSTANQKLLINEIKNNNIVYILDPEAEYKKITKFFGGNYINMGASIYRINPLQIFASIDDLEVNEELNDIQKTNDFWNVKNKNIDTTSKVSLNSKLISEHQAVLEVMFTTLWSDIDDEKLRFIKAEYADFMWYWVKRQTQNSISSEISDWENEHFPIFQNWYEYLLIKLENEKKINPNITVFRKKLEDLIDILEKGLVHNKAKNSYGEYHIYWNGITTLNVKNDEFNSIVCFDLQSLFVQQNLKLRRLQMYFVIRYIDQQVLLVSKQYPHLKQRVIIDEGHLMINSERPLELDFIHRMVKMVRKRNGGITIVTQNPEDFTATPGILNKSKAIITNSQYAVIMQATKDNIDQIEMLFADSDGFNDVEKSRLVNARTGEGLLIVGNHNQRYEVKFDISQTDFQVINNDQSDLWKFVEKDLALRLFNALGQLGKTKGIDYDLEILNENPDDYSSFLEMQKDNENGELSGVLKIKLKHKLNLEEFSKNMEIEQIEQDENNWVTITFKNEHKVIAKILYAKYIKKIKARLDLFKGQLVETDIQDLEKYEEYTDRKELVEVDEQEQEVI